MFLLYIIFVIIISALGIEPHLVSGLDGMLGTNASGEVWFWVGFVVAFLLD